MTSVSSPPPRRCGRRCNRMISSKAMSASRRCVIKARGAKRWDVARTGLAGQRRTQIEDAGSHPWSIENGILSTLLLFNHSPKPQYFNVRIANDRVVWLKVYKLNSMETKAISINDLISSQEKETTGMFCLRTCSKAKRAGSHRRLPR